MTASPSIETGIAAAAAGDHDRAALEQRDDVLLAEDLDRVRARHHAPPAAAGVGRDVPAEFLRAALGLLLVVERADRLGRVREGLVGGVHQHAREQDGGRDARVDLRERRLEQVADLALGHRDQRVERERRGLLLAELLLQQQRADVRAVAVGEHDLVTGRAQGEHGLDDLAHVLELLRPRSGLTGLDQGVAADGDDDAHRMFPIVYAPS